MLEFKCVNTPIMDWEKCDGATVGRFSGTVKVSGDMRRPEYIIGDVEFDNANDYARIELSQLLIDIKADRTGVFCLYHDPAQQEEEQAGPSNAAEFTPGPWTVEGRAILTDDRNRNSVATVSRFGAWLGGNTQYTARLIAAAPYLLKALATFPELPDDWAPCNEDAHEAFTTAYHLWSEVARAAVAKAKGTTNA